MFQAYLSTLFFIFMTLGLGLVTLSVIFGKLGLWLGTAIFSVLILRWLLYEFQPPNTSCRELGAHFLHRRIGWYQNSARYFIDDQALRYIKIRLYSFKKPEIILSEDLLNHMPMELLQITLLYFCEVTRILDVKPWAKVTVIFMAILGFDVSWRFNSIKEEALLHLHKWHGLDQTAVKVRLQQARYYIAPKSTELPLTFVNSFPRSLPKGVEI